MTIFVQRVAAAAAGSMLFVLPLAAQYPGQNNDLQVIAGKIPLKAQSFPLQDVRLLSSRFEENRQRDAQWLLSLSNNRLLHSFRVNAGIKTSAVALGGWEGLDIELRGHSMGHILSSLALMYASTGDAVYKNKADSLVAALAAVQQVLNQDGYLSAFPPYFIDRCIAWQGVWAPWYTLHKIMAGLLDMYTYAGNKQALDIVSRMAGWTYKKLSPLTQEQLDVMLKNEFGGMNEVCYNLYAVTGNKNDLALAAMFFHHAVLDPLAAQQDKLNKLHANTQIPKVIGVARGYELTGDEQEKNIARFFWETVINTQTFATGGNSDREHFIEPGKLSEHLSAYSAESCNTYNMLKLTRHLFTWTADVKYADYYEQALYNHILASQDPETGMFCYLMPLQPGAFKLYSNHDHSFWCCVGSGSESHAKYGEGIYYHDDKGIFVNLFIPSVLNWKEKGIQLKQETLYPESGTIALTFTGNSQGVLPLYIRYPSWAVSGAVVKLNGKSIRVQQQPGSYITLNRQWHNNDKVEIIYPMSLRTVTTPDNPAIAAIAYGPVILAGDMGTEGMKAPEPYAAPDAPYTYSNYNYHVPAGLVHTLQLKQPLTASIHPVAGAAPLSFEAASPSGKISLVPFYRLHHRRYVVYWNLQ